MSMSFVVRIFLGLTFVFISCSRLDRSDVEKEYNRTRDLKGLNLKGLNLTELNFKHADFQGSDLEGVDFSNSNLNYVNFSNSNLKGAKFGGSVTFEEANFCGADLRNATFSTSLLLNDIIHDSLTIVDGSNIYQSREEYNKAIEIDWDSFKKARENGLR